MGGGGGIPLPKLSVEARDEAGGGAHHLLKLSVCGGKRRGKGNTITRAVCLWGQEKGEREYHYSR